MLNWEVDAAVARDYGKFLTDEGRLNVRLIQRPIYLEMLERYKARPEKVDKVFGELYWLWDLNQRARQAEAEGRAASRVELARELMGEMDDQDWWKVTETFEQSLWADFADEARLYADLLDPVYDVQEAEGWRERHYEPVAGPRG